MRREIVQVDTEEVKLGLVDSAVDALLTRAERNTAVRVHDRGAIGLSSASGEVPLQVLTDRARQSLRSGVPGPDRVPPVQQLHTEAPGAWLDPGELVERIGALLASLRADYPSLILSNLVRQTRNTVHFTDDRGLDLRHSATSTELELYVKERGSPGIIDTMLAARLADLEVEPLRAEFARQLEAYLTPIEAAPVGRQRVLFRGVDMLQHGVLMRAFVGDCLSRTYATGGSVFDGKLGGPPVFHRRFGLVDSRDHRRRPVVPFDLEGMVRPTPDLPLFEQGRLCAVLADLRDARRYGSAPTASAGGPLHELPGTAISYLDPAPTHQSLIDLLGGEPAILAHFSIGGDLTRQGELGMPVQVALQLDAEGRLLGRLPELSISGSLWTALGDDFVGVTEQDASYCWPERWLLTHLQVAG